ncbi:phage tail protein [Salinarimonas sp. NSM]|uniref:phage tail protein n=1 Tax=Salinarimonas sp. NSM TaxID=3458003 RepID=UPI004037539E
MHALPWLLAVALLAATTTAAQADPVTIIAGIVTTLLPATSATLIAGVTIAQAVATAVVVGAGVAISAAAGGGRRGGAATAQSIDPGSAKSTFESADGDEIRAIGRARIGGLKAFGNTAGANRYRLIWHAGGPFAAPKLTAIERYWFGGREVIVDDNDAVSSPPYARPGGASWLYWRTKVGDGTETAWNDLLVDFPGLWTAAHRCRGIAQSLIIAISPGLGTELFLKLWQSGPPDAELEGRWEPMFDPRDPAQVFDVPTSWKWTDNGILAALHVARRFPFVASDFDLDAIAAEADLADALVPIRGGGAEKRARAWGVFSESTDRETVLADVLRSIGAEQVETDGKIWFRLVDDVRAPEVQFTEDDIVNVKWTNGPEGVDRPNVCRVAYYSPERNYSVEPLDMTGVGWARIESEIARYGEQITEVRLLFCPSASQAQRVARRLFYLERARSGIVEMHFSGLAAVGCKTISFPLPDLDTTEVAEIGQVREKDDEGRCEIPFRVQPALPPWNPAVDEAPAPEQIPDLAFQSSVPKPAQMTGAAVVVYPSNGVAVTRFGYVNTGFPTTEAIYRTIGVDGPTRYRAMNELLLNGVTHAFVVGNLSGQQVEARHRVFNADSEPSNFSDVLAVVPAIINAPPGAVGLSVVETPGDPPTSAGTATLTIDSPSSLFLASVAWRQRTTRFGTPGAWSSWTVLDARPGERFTVAAALPQPSDQEGDNLVVTFEAQARSSNGTPSATASASVTVEAISN